MVRVNIFEPRLLADQHLVAEYNEILMLVGYVKKYPSLSGIPENYVLGKGHLKFFKNKLNYLKKRHEQIKWEMGKRGFVTNKRLNLAGFGKSHLNDWTPNRKDFSKIRKRLAEKLALKPDFYRYYGKKKQKSFFAGLIRKS